MIERSIYLASRSPRRRELLAQIGVRFHLLLFRARPGEGADVDEAPLAGELPAG
jgi:septum formation protein